MISTPKFCCRLSRTGFSIIELLVVIGVTAILLSFLAPALSRTRGQSLETKTASNLRQMFVGLQMYADTNKDLPPTYSEPFWPERRRWVFDFGTVGEGYWFDHRWLYAYAITGHMGNTQVAIAPGNTNPRPPVTHRGVTMSRSDFDLTSTLYADPAFFNWKTQVGLSQFGAQRLSRIAFPSAKGILWPPILYHYTGYGPVVGCCEADLKTPIVFGDSSVASHVAKGLNGGIVNLYGVYHILSGLDPREMRIGGCDSTIDGVLGRDR